MSYSTLTIRIPVSAFEHQEDSEMVEGITQEGKEFLSLLDVVFPGFLSDFTLGRFNPNQVTLLDLIRQHIKDQKGFTVGRYYDMEEREGQDLVSLSINEKEQSEVFSRVLKAIERK